MSYLGNVLAAVMPPQRHLATMMPEFRSFRSALMGVRDSSSLASVSDLYNVVSKWQEHGLLELIVSFESVNINQWFDEVIKKLKELQACIDQAVEEGLVIGVRVPDSQKGMVLSQELQQKMIKIIGDIEFLVSFRLA